MPKWSRNRQYASHLKTLHKSNLKEAQDLLNTLAVKVAFDEAVAACAVKDVAYGIFINALQREMEMDRKELEDIFKAFFRTNDPRSRDRVISLEAIENAANFVMSKCDIVWQMEGLPADFMRRVPMPVHLHDWMHPSTWTHAILEYFHPEDSRRLPLARQAWEQKIFGKKVAEKKR